MVIINGHDNITRVMATSDMSYTGETGILPILTIGVYKILKKEPILKVEGVPAVEEPRV